MAKKIQFRIIDKNKIEILEDASKGDFIDLTDHLEIDTTPIENAIKENREAIFNREIEKLQSEWKAKKDLEIKEKESKLKELISKLNNDIENLKNNKEIEIKNAILSNSKEKDEQIASLKEEILKINATNKEENIKEKNAFEQKMSSSLLEKEQEITSLKNKIATNEQLFNLKVNEEVAKHKEDFANKKNQLELEIEKIKNASKIDLYEKEKELNENFESEKKKLEEKISYLETENSHLNLVKSSLNVKKLGEELEKWCNNEYLAASVSSFENATWEKDNTAIKEDGDVKGTKADYIFKVFLSPSDISDLNVISSVCCEMKNESNVSQNKKKNSDHFKKLDEDRNKKKCEYALLVSELEWDTNNDAPIRKVPGYEKMYVVRPQYMMSFLSLIYSLSMKFKEIILEKHKEVDKLKDSTEIIQEFEEFKERYLFNPLKSLETKIASLLKNSEAIKKANDENIANITLIQNTTLTTIKEKIERFDIKKIERKVKKLENSEEK